MNNKKVLLLTILLVVIYICVTLLFKLPIKLPFFSVRHSVIPGINITTECSFDYWSAHDVHGESITLSNGMKYHGTGTCYCTAISDGKKFDKIYYKELNTNHEPTDEEKSCDNWCENACEEDAKQYFNRKI